MLKAEFSQAYKIADNEKIELNNDNAPIDIFDGFGLKDFQPVYVTIEQVARLIRWQCSYVYGATGFDSENLNEIGHFGRKRFLIIG